MGWVAAVARSGRLAAMSLPSAAEEVAVAACGVEADFGRRDPLLAALADDLSRYFAGQPVDLGRYPVDLGGHPPFRRHALLARTYGWVARRAGRSRAARAAGQAMSRNPIPLVIPCHRVIAAGDRMGGFGGGLEMKRALLSLEGHRCDDYGLLP